MAALNNKNNHRFFTMIYDYSVAPPAFPLLTSHPTLIYEWKYKSPLTDDKPRFLVKWSREYYAFIYTSRLADQLICITSCPLSTQPMSLSFVKFCARDDNVVTKNDFS